MNLHAQRNLDATTRISPSNNACPLLDECAVRAKIAWIETRTIVPPKAGWLYEAADVIEVVVLTCRSHGRRFASVPYTRADKQPDAALHELVTETGIPR